MLKVSVLMPVYNCVVYLREAIESIRNQTFDEFELVIVNDGSTDDTPAILSEYAEKDKRIRVIHNQKNRGIVASLNRGLHVCRGQYIARMDGDDVALPERLATQLTRIERDPVIAALGAALVYIDEKGDELGITRYCEVHKRSFLARTPLLHPTVLLRRETLERFKLHYRERYRYAEDYFLWLELARVAKLDAMDDVVLKYRLHNGASRIAHLKKMIMSELKVKKDAMIHLHIRPTAGDILHMLIEASALCLPRSLVYLLYRRFVLQLNKSEAVQ